MLRSPLRIAFLVTIAASLAAYTAGCGTDGDDTFPDGDASSDSAPAMDGSSGSDASDSGHDAGGDATTSDASFCEQVEIRTVTCEAGTFDASVCQTQEACFDNILRPAANGLYKGCVSGRACNVGDDSCVVSAGSAFLDAGPYDTFQSDCLAKRTTCSGQDAGFADDNCSAVQAALVNDAIFGRMQGCIGQACPGVKTCLSGIFIEAGCK
ncbi:MAG: hypothetical protein ABIP39_02030 [Polyangiaceae bacterium]